jgi:hypothetical protein
VTKFGSSRAKSASQKPYSVSLGAGSERRQFWRPARPVVGAHEQSGWSLGDGDAGVSRGKTLVADLVRFSVAGSLLI